MSSSYLDCLVLLHLERNRLDKQGILRVSNLVIKLLKLKPSTLVNLVITAAAI